MAVSDDRKYTKEFVYNLLEGVKGKTLGEVDKSNQFARTQNSEKITGIAGDVIEQSVFGYERDSKQECDIEIDGVLTELKTTDNTYTYFAIFKPWVSKQADFTKLLDTYRGEYLGIDIDGFVSPYLVPLEEQKIFAVPLNYQSEEDVEAINILYNSGIISTSYSLVTEENLEPQIIKVNYVGISIGFVVSLLLTYLSLVLLKHDDINMVKKALLASMLTICIYLSILKIFNIPVDTFLLPIVAILTFLLIKTLVVNLDSVIYIEIALITVFLIVKIVGYGYAEILASHLIWLVLLSKVSLIASEWYLNKLKEI